MSGHRSQTSRLTEAQLVDWLRLIRSENIGPRTFRELVSRYGGASAALEALPELLARKLRGREIKIASRDDALREIEASRAQGVRFIAISDLDYPATLREIDSAPPLLALRGDATALSRPLVAIVGARNPRLRVSPSPSSWRAISRVRITGSCRASRAASTRPRIAQA